uniref:Integrase catalytic domain-containing protein n=1 Tax=Rhabditophanes sp. KR3021 TaxID=114890 RepID=A0AC35UI93_9BILA
MSTIVTQEVAGCELCAKCKKNPARKFVKWTRARYPREMGSFDLCYVDSKCIIVFVDHYSSYTYGAILKSKNQENLINFFTGIFQEHPFTLVISDGEPSLNSEGLNQFFKNSKIGLYQNGKSEEMGTERVTTPKYHPSSNGRIEGRIQDVKTKMQIAKLENKCVSEQLSFALASLNNMPAAWTDEEGNLKRSTPAQRYFVNDEVRPSRWNNEVVDCSPSQIYFKPRGHLSKMFELGSKVGELGDSIYLIQD